MIKAAEMAKMVAQNSTEIVNSVSVHFDDFFNVSTKCSFWGIEWN